MTRVSPLEGHGLWAPLYDTGPNPLLALEARVLAPLLGPVRALTVVDVACGTGRWAERLSGLGARVIGIDACRQMLGCAAGKPGLAGRLALADALALPLRSESADLAICSFALGYISDLDGAIAEMARVTKRGGSVVISDLHPLAAAAGWTRSFRADGGVYEIAHFTRTAQQLRAGMLLAGLELELQIDQRFEDPERPIFLAAGKGAVFAEISSLPAVWIGIWKKP